HDEQRRGDEEDAPAEQRLPAIQPQLIRCQLLAPEDHDGCTKPQRLLASTAGSRRQTGQCSFHLAWSPERTNYQVMIGAAPARATVARAETATKAVMMRVFIVGSPHPQWGLTSRRTICRGFL